MVRFVPQVLLGGIVPDQAGGCSKPASSLATAGQLLQVAGILARIQAKELTRRAVRGTPEDGWRRHTPECRDASSSASFEPTCCPLASSG